MMKMVAASLLLILITAPVPAFPTAPTDHYIELGIDPDLDHTASAHTIKFHEFFSGSTPPVIIAGIPTTNGPDFFSVRVKDVTKEGFSFFGKEASCLDQIHYYKERVPWMAVAPGAHTTPGGQMIEAGFVNLATTATAVRVSFGQDSQFYNSNNYIVLATVQTANEPEAIMLRVEEKDAYGFTLRTQLDEGNRQVENHPDHQEETIGYVVMSVGQGNLAGNAYIARATEMPITDPEGKGPGQPVTKNVFQWNSLGGTVNGVYSNTWPADACHFGTFSFSGGNSAILRTGGSFKATSSTAVTPQGGIGKFTIQEDYCKDEEVWHKAEAVYLLTIPECAAGITHPTPAPTPQPTPQPTNPPCPKDNQEWKTCETACPATCGIKPAEICTKQCVIGCGCKAGFKRSTTGEDFECVEACADCTLTGGETVADGWSGQDTGSNHCNTCNCQNGMLACTKMACPAPVVAGDPFVIDATGAKVQFFLPLYENVHLLSCGELRIYGRAFGTGVAHDHQQWFDRFQLSVDGEDALAVEIAKNSTTIDDTMDITTPGNHDLGSSELKTLKVMVEGHAMTRTGAVGVVGGSLVAVWQTGSTETVQFSNGNMVLQIQTAVAQKFDSKQVQQLYTHLDLRFIEMRQEQCTEGILAEIWGTVQMSQKTAAMLHPPNTNNKVN